MYKKVGVNWMVNYCSKGLLAATVRPWWFVRRNLFSFKLKNIFLRENDPILIQKVANELFESATVEQVFAANDEALMSSRRVWPKDALFNHGYDLDMVNEAFLWGLYAEFLEGRPLIPTAPRYRLMAYMIDYLSRYYDEPVYVTRVQVLKVESAFNAADPLTREIVRIGRLAFRDSSNWHLNACHRLAATWKT
jgi:hypothetical protein